MPKQPLLFYFLLVVVFFISLSVLLLELTLTRIYSIILYYDYAFMVISIAFFGLGIGSFLVYIVKERVQKHLPSTIAKASSGFAISIAIFLVFGCRPALKRFIYYIHSGVLRDS